MQGPVRAAACAVVLLACLVACTQPQMRTIRHPNGSRKGEGPFQDGKRRSEGVHRNGCYHGRWILWHENGAKESEGEFRDGEQDGTWRTFYDTGEKLAKGPYRDGLMHGHWTFWYKNGDVHEGKSGVYEAGFRASK